MNWIKDNSDLPETIFLGLVDDEVYFLLECKEPKGYYQLSDNYNFWFGYKGKLVTKDGIDMWYPLPKSLKSDSDKLRDCRMKLFIFDVEILTDNYHPYGSCIIVADDLQDAINQFNKYSDDVVASKRLCSPGHIPTLNRVDIESAVVYELARDYPKEIIIHADAGCC